MQIERPLILIFCLVPMPWQAGKKKQSEFEIIRDQSEGNVEDKDHDLWIYDQPFSFAFILCTIIGGNCKFSTMLITQRGRN